MTSSSIAIRFAIDHNRDRKIDRNEYASIEELKALDTSGDEFLKGDELDPVYYEYGKDKWLQAGRTHRLTEEKSLTSVNLHLIGLEPPKVEMDINVRLRS
jgi:hypothetical protein